MIMKWPFSKTTETKSTVSEAQLLHAEQHDYAMKEWAQYITEGYAQNPTIYRCVDIIASNAASIRPRVEINGELVEDHPLEKLLANPNVDCGDIEFRTEAFSWALITGNVYCEALKVGRDVRELWHWQPTVMSIDKSKMNPRIPAAYWANRNQAGQRRWEVDPVTGRSDMMHWGLFNPASDKAFLGQAPLAAAASSGDQLNAANKWRYNLLKNDCRPSGVLSTDQQITTTDRKTLSADLKKAKAGNSDFLLLGGGLKWTQLGMTMKDADHLAGSKFNKQEIAEVFGVPAQLLGIEGSQTYANFEEARYAFYLMTVLPLVDLYYSELTRWLGPLFGEGVRIVYDLSEIDALDAVRNEKVQALLNTDVLTINEKRALLGYEAVNEPDADAIFVNPSMLPIGMEMFSPEEQAIQQAAKSFMGMGMKADEAQQKAFEILAERKCLHHHDS